MYVLAALLFYRFHQENRDYDAIMCRRMLSLLRPPDDRAGE